MTTESSQSNRTSTATSTADNRVAADHGAIVVRDGSVSVTDGGAIEMAGDVSERAIDLAGDVAIEAFDFSNGALIEGASLLTESVRASNDALFEIIQADRTEEAQLASQLFRLGIPAAAFVAVACNLGAQMSYTDVTYVLPANGAEDISRFGAFVTCLAASKDFRIRVDQRNEHRFEAGLTRRKDGGFEHIRIINPHPQPITVRLGIGSGDIDDNRVTISNDAGLATREQVPDVITGARSSCPNGQSTLILSANPLRKEAIITADGDQSGAIYISGSGAPVSFQDGVPLLPNQAVTLTTTAAIYVRNDTGATVFPRILKVEYSS